MEKRILIKPIISEKAEKLSNQQAQYSFVVEKDANKIEIGKAVQNMYGVNVDSVNTMILPSKQKMRTTKSGVLRGRRPAYKKAVVTLAKGEEIDFFGNI